MNRIVLKVYLLENNGLKINLYHLDTRFMSNKFSEFVCFNTTKYDFCLYSRRTMAITVNSLRLPDKDHYKSEQSVTHTFISEQERYDFLKALHNCLFEWNNNYTPFTKDVNHKKRNRTIIMSGEFWVI